MEAGRAVMSGGSRARRVQRGKYNETCRATWVLLWFGRREEGGGVGRTCTNARRHYFFMDAGVRKKNYTPVALEKWPGLSARS